MWLLRRAAEEPIAAHVDRRERWKIRCFGRLRIYRNDGSQVKWDAPGGATRKEQRRCLLTCCRKAATGAATDELADLLWPESDSIETARNRLYHTVRCLRQALSSASNDCDTGQHVLRDGLSLRSDAAAAKLDRHLHVRATVPAIANPHQRGSGRRGPDLPASGRPALYRRFVRGYSGRICRRQRARLVLEQALLAARHVLQSAARRRTHSSRARQDYSAALAHCNKALAIDPLCEIAHEEAMQGFLRPRPARSDRSAIQALSGLAQPF